MWITKRAYHDLLAGFARREQELLRQLIDRDSTIDRLRSQLHDAEVRAHAAELRMRDKVISLVGDTRAALVRADLQTIELNQLREERAILLDKALQGIGGFKPQVPHVGPQQRTTEPGVSFEDVGDEQAAASGLVPEPDPWPMHDLGDPGAVDEQRSVGFGDTAPDAGAPGTVYNPAAAGY